MTWEEKDFTDEHRHHLNFASVGKLSIHKETLFLFITDVRCSQESRSHHDDNLIVISPTE